MSFLQTTEFWETTGVLAAVSAACSLPGVFLVLRKMALLSDAVGHVLLFGIVVAFLFVRDHQSLWLTVGAAGAGLLTVVLVEWTSRNRLVRQDAAIGLVFPALFAAGVILATLEARNIHLDVDAVMLGQVELAPQNRWVIAERDFGPRGIWTALAVFAVQACLTVGLFKELRLASFDPGSAAAVGFMPSVLHYGLMTGVSVSAVVSFDAVGPVLVVAYFVVPPAIAYLLTDRLATMAVLAVVVGVIGSLVGNSVAHAIDANVAGTTAGCFGGLFAVAWIASPRHGVWVHARRRRRQRDRFHAVMVAVHVRQHEGTPEEATENRRATLHEHFRGPERRTHRAVSSAIERGWIEDRDGRLQLTPLGRTEADLAANIGRLG